MLSSSRKPRIHLVYKSAIHFLRWELPYIKRSFQITRSPDANTILFAYGPDAFFRAIEMPALKRVALLLPGWGFQPYFDEKIRHSALEVIDKYYDLVFANPGPIYAALKSNSKVISCPFSIDTSLAGSSRPRTAINSLLHVSADSPQKDWQRSEQIMSLTGLSFEVYPPRLANMDVQLAQTTSLKLDRPKSIFTRAFRSAKFRGASYVKTRVNQIAVNMGKPRIFMPPEYKPHHEAIAKYRQFDGFVHIASKTPPITDGKYTASLLEAGATGAILFWHDTLGLGNDFETIFDLPLEPELAATEILNVRANIDVERHSQRTIEEICERCSPERVAQIRFDSIKTLL